MSTESTLARLLSEAIERAEKAEETLRVEHANRQANMTVSITGRPSDAEIAEIVARTLEPHLRVFPKASTRDYEKDYHELLAVLRQENVPGCSCQMCLSARRWLKLEEEAK